MDNQSRNAQRLVKKHGLFDRWGAVEAAVARNNATLEELSTKRSAPELLDLAKQLADEQAEQLRVNARKLDKALLRDHELLKYLSDFQAQYETELFTDFFVEVAEACDQARKYQFSEKGTVSGQKNRIAIADQKVALKKMKVVGIGLAKIANLLGDSDLDEAGRRAIDRALATLPRGAMLIHGTASQKTSVFQEFLFQLGTEFTHAAASPRGLAQFQHGNLILPVSQFGPGSRPSQPETGLAFHLVYLFRKLTFLGGKAGNKSTLFDRAEFEPMPKFGRPCYETVANLVQHTLQGELTASEIKARLTGLLNGRDSKRGRTQGPKSKTSIEKFARSVFLTDWK